MRPSGFMTSSHSLATEFLALGLTYFTVKFCAELGYAFLADRTCPWLGSSGNQFNRCCALAFSAIGITLPL